jgi:hypothetical protein
MESCYNHPGKKAYSICHNCDRNFCEDCLTAGTEFYYCNSPECQQKLEKETRWKRIICPNCLSVLEISWNELKSWKLRCPECDTFIILVDSKSETAEDKNYIQLLSSLNQGDIAIIKSMLDNAGIDYYVTGENTLGVLPLVEPAVFYVNEKDFELSKYILKDFELDLFGFSANNDKENDL